MSRKVFFTLLIALILFAVPSLAAGENYIQNGNTATVTTLEGLKSAIADATTAGITEIVIADDLGTDDSPIPNGVITVDGITISGDKNGSKPTLTVGGANETGTSFITTKNGAKLVNLTIKSNFNTQNSGSVWLVRPNDGATTIEGCDFEGLYAFGDAGVVYAIHTDTSYTNITVDNCRFNKVRQPAFVNKSANGTVTVKNCETNGTRGWCVYKNADVTFTNNTFGTNVRDIVIMNDTTVAGDVNDCFANILAISKNNNNAYVEEQYNHVSAKGGNYYVEAIDANKAANQHALFAPAFKRAQTCSATIDLASEYTETGALTLEKGKSVIINTNNNTLTLSENMTVEGTLTLTGNGRVIGTTGKPVIINKSTNTVYIDGVAVGEFGEPGIQCVGGRVVINKMPALGILVEMTDPRDSVQLQASPTKTGNLNIQGDCASVDNGTTITYFNGITEALKSIEGTNASNTIVTVTKDGTVDEDITLPNGITIDLGGNTITPSGNATITVPTGASVTIGSSGSQTGSIPINGSKVTVEAGETETIDNKPKPTVKNSPIITGSNTITAKAGKFGATTVTAELKDAAFGAGIGVTAKLAGLSASATATENGELKFTFAADDLNKLAVGAYEITASAEGNSDNNAIAATKIGTLTVEKADDPDDPADPDQPGTAGAFESLPKTCKITVGYSHALAVADPAGAKLDLNFKTSNKKVATIDRAGVITGVKPGKATVSLKVGKKTHKCAVTVVANSFSRSKPLMIKNQKGVFTSMRQLAYKDGGLSVEVFVYNRTSKKVRGYADYKLQIMRGDEVLLTKPINEAAHEYTKPLTVKGYKTIKLSITADELAGIDAKAFNLAAGELQAVIIGTDSNGNAAIPVTSQTPGYVRVKTAEMVRVDDVNVGQ